MHPYSARPVTVAAPLFRARLHEARGDLGVRELAKLSGVDKETISRWLKGPEGSVNVDAVGKVAAALGTTVEHLLDLPVDTQAPPEDEPRPWLPAIDRAEGLLKELAAALDEARSAGFPD